MPPPAAKKPILRPVHKVLILYVFIKPAVEYPCVEFFSESNTFTEYLNTVYLVIQVYFRNVKLNHTPSLLI